MNGLNNSNDDAVECPLCMEPLEVDDLNFYPCTCGYQICRFCWHRIRTDENELCPACRKEYPENPADFTPLTQEEMIAFKSQKRQRDQQRKQKITENRKHLSNVRVVQKNLVFVVGLSPRLADADILKKHEYFGKYGKIHKVVINPSTTYAGVQGPSASAYVTYVHNSDALRAIQSVNNIMIDGRLIKTSLGTTKYCSHFMKNQQCPKADCMYLHELGDAEASFTKEEMHQGKHQEYEKRLHEALIATSGTSSINGIGLATSSSNSAVPPLVGVGLISSNHSSKNGDSNKGGNGSTLVSLSSQSSAAMSSSSSSSSSFSSATNGAMPPLQMASGTQQKEAWPSLSVSPVNSKEISGGINNGKNKREKNKQEKLKNEKNTKTKNNKIQNNNHNSNNISHLLNKEITQSLLHNGTQEPMLADFGSELKTNNSTDQNCNSSSTFKRDKNKEKAQQEKYYSNHDTRDHQSQSQQQQKRTRVISADEEIKLIEDSKKQSSSGNSNKNTSKNIDVTKKDGQRSLSSSSNNSCSSNSSSINNNSDSTSTLSDSISGKSSPSSLPESHSTTEKRLDLANNEKQFEFSLDGCHNTSSSHQLEQDISSVACNSNEEELGSDSCKSETNINTADIKASNRKQLSASNAELQFSNDISSNTIMDTTDALSKLNIFDDNNSFFSSSSSASFQHSLLLKNKAGNDMRQNQMNSVTTSHLPDLLNGIGGHQTNTAKTNEWEEAFKNVMQQQQLKHKQQVQHQQQLQQQEEFLRIQELQKHNSLLNNIGMSEMNGSHNDFSNNYHGASDFGRLSQAALIQQQQLLSQQQAGHPSEHLISNSMFGANMSKFFDFHKNQQQQMHQQYLLNGHSGGSGSSLLNEHARMASLLENNRINSRFLDQSNGLLSTQQQQLQKERLLSNYDPTLPHQQDTQPTQPQQTQGAQPQTQPNRLPNPFSQNTIVDDDLGFDPFIETQKALAELMENEVVQQQNTTAANSNSSGATKLLHHQHQQQQLTQQQLLDNMQRARLPPPGFNHMNAFGFGVPRAQNTNKMLPFMNVPGNGAPASGQPVPQQQMQMPGVWNPHLAAFQQQPMNDPQMHQINQNQSGGHSNKGYSNNDWTAMDPAILSFRQFSSFQQPQMPHYPQQQDMFLQHMSQHQQQQNSQGFNSQLQLHAGINNMLNTQQNSQSQCFPINSFASKEA